MAPEGSILRDMPNPARTPARSFRWHLARMVVLALLPLLAASLAGGWLVARQQGQELRRELLATARFHAAIADAEIERLKRVVSALSAIELLAADLPAERQRDMHLAVSRIAAEQDVVLWLEGPTTGQATLLVPGSGVPAFGEALPEAAIETRRRSASSGRPELGDLTTGLPGLAGPAAPLIKALPQQRGAVGVAVTPAALMRVMQAQWVGEPRSATLLDGAALRVARLPLAPELIGGQVSAPLVEAVAGADMGVVEGRDVLGISRLAGFARLPNNPAWTVVHAVPAHVVAASWQKPVLVVAAGLAGSLALAALLAAVSARQLLHPLERAAARAQAAAAGVAAAPAGRQGSRVVEFERLEADALRSQARLSVETALLRAVVQSTVDPVFVRDTQGVYLMANDAAAAVLGVPRAQIAGRTDAELRPDTAARFRDSDLAVLHSGRPITFEERVPAGPAGAERVWLTAKSPWRNPATGELLGVVGVAHEITSRLARDRRLREAEQALQALDRRARVSAMASGIAHELSQPLTAAQNFLAVAQRALPEAPAPLRRAAEELDRAAETLHAVRGFLAQGQVERRREDVGQVVAGAARLAAAGSRGVRLCLHVAPGLPRLCVSAVQLRQVMFNLVNNAMEAMAMLPPHAMRRIDVSVAAEGAGIVVAVADSGPGLSADAARAALEPFSSTKPDGSGLGLAICRAIVEAHGGRLGLAPGEHGGAVARFTLAGAPA